MPNDAKVGLVLGVGLIVVVAVVFFRRDLASANVALDANGAAAVQAPGSTMPPGHTPVRPAQATTNIPTDEAPPSGGVRRHTVKENETLYRLAEYYYGDGDRFVDIYRANKNVLRSPDQLTPGMVLIIPDLSTRQ